MSQFHFNWISIFTIALSGTLQNAHAQPSLPPGFRVSIVAKNIKSPTSAEFAPDGRLFISQKAGQLRVVKQGILLQEPFLTVETDSAGEHGLLGIAFDPAFSKNSYIYVYYIAKTPQVHARVSRFTAQGDVALPGSETPIIDLDARGTSIFHVSGALHFGLDGTLYVSSGDNAGTPLVNNSQSLTNTLGKILRFNSDGSIPTDNPFYTTASGNNRAIWAYGLRNPFSFAIQPTTGKIYANDVGQLSWEEIDEIAKGENYGWPAAEGASTEPKFRNPIYAYPHDSSWEGGCGITGGNFYNPIIPQFPTQYVGKYFFIDYCKNWIHIFDPESGTVSPFAKNITSSGVGLTVGPDGSIYFLSQWLNNVQKLSFTENPTPRSGSITATPNPIQVCDGTLGGSTTLQWTSQGTQQVEIHINAPNGNPLVSSPSGPGTYTTPKWVGDGSTFYLQDVSEGLALTPENTLSSVVVQVTQSGCMPLRASRQSHK